jgi:hypothetical protein
MGRQEWPEVLDTYWREVLVRYWREVLIGVLLARTVDPVPGAGAAATGGGDTRPHRHYCKQGAPWPAMEIPVLGWERPWRGKGSLAWG